MNNDLARGLVVGAVLGVLAWNFFRDRLAWIDRELERLDRNFCDHCTRDDMHAPPRATTE